jgi:hypothetical protein
LYFHPGQSFSVADEQRLDRLILSSLVQNHVTAVVLERASFMGTHKILGHFPLLSAWIRDHFEFAEQFGNYRLLQVRPSATPNHVSAAVTASQ